MEQAVEHRGDGRGIAEELPLSFTGRFDVSSADARFWRPLTPIERRHLLEVLQDRAERASTLITSRVPVKGWHDLIGEPTHADAICDRLIHTAYVIELHGPSLRETRAQPGGPTAVDLGPHQPPRPSPSALESGREGSEVDAARRLERGDNRGASLRSDERSRSSARVITIVRTV